MFKLFVTLRIWLVSVLLFGPAFALAAHFSASWQEEHFMGLMILSWIFGGLFSLFGLIPLALFCWLIRPQAFKACYFLPMMALVAAASAAYPSINFGKDDIWGEDRFMIYLPSLCAVISVLLQYKYITSRCADTIDSEVQDYLHDKEDA